MKKKIIYTIILIIIFVGVMHALPQQYEPYQQLIPPSEQYYNEKFNRTPFLRGAGGNDNGDFGDDTSEISTPNDASDAPLGDGILLLLLFVFGYQVIVSLKRK